MPVFGYPKNKEDQKFPIGLGRRDDSVIFPRFLANQTSYKKKRRETQKKKIPGNVIYRFAINGGLNAKRFGRFLVLG